MKLSVWAEQNGIFYQTAWKWFTAGKLPVPAIQTPAAPSGKDDDFQETTPPA